MTTSKASNQDTVLYHVLPGDNLSKIIANYYGHVSPQQQKSIISQIQADNPAITNPNLIRPGQVLLIDVPQQYCPAPGRETPVIQADKLNLKPLQEHWRKSTPEQQNLIKSLAPTILLGSGSASMTMVDYTFKTNTQVMASMVENYNDFKAGKITRGQYDYRRRQLLNLLDNNLGPVRRLLGDNRPSNEILRISRNRGSVPTTPLSQQTDKMLKLSKIASRSGVVLSAAGLGVACYQIANTSSVQEKNEIFWEGVGGFAGGALYGVGAGLAIAMMATPIGWVGALVIGVGGALVGIGAGHGAKSLYNLSGTSIDFVKASKIDNLCK